MDLITLRKDTATTHIYITNNYINGDGNSVNTVYNDNNEMLNQEKAKIWWRKIFKRLFWFLKQVLTWYSLINCLQLN